MKLYTNPSGTEYVEFAAPRPGASLTSEIATRGIDGVFGSFYQTIPNPDPVLKKTGNYIDILDEIRREPHVSSCSISRESGAMLREWKLEQGSASARSVEVVETILKQLDMRQIIREIMEAWGYGYQISEVVWERSDNLWIPARVVGKPRRWFLFGQQNELRMKTKQYDLNGSPVEDRKFLLTRYRASYDNPYGEAQYSLCFWPVTFKKGGLKFWAKFLERFGMPHAVGKHSRNASLQERNILLSALMRMVQDACAVIPEDGSVELLTSNVSGSADAYERYARYHDGQISTVVLGHSAAADSTPGRLGGEDLAMSVRTDIIENDCSMVQDTINTLINWIHELNPSLGTERPAFELYEETTVDPVRAERDAKLAGTGQVRFTKKYYVNKYDFAEDEIDIVAPVAPSAPEPQNPLPEFAAPLFAATNSDDGQSEIDALADAMTKNPMLQAAMEELLNPVFELIKNSETFEDMSVGLAKLYPELDDAAIAKRLEMAMFLSDTWGRLKTNEAI